MSWESYWWPNLIQWIGGGAVTALVGAAVGLVARYYFRQFFDQIMGGQDQTRHAAEAAASRAGEAKESAASADDSAQQANAALEFMADRLGEVLAEKDVMAKRNDDMFAANITMRRVLQENNIPLPREYNPEGNPTGENEALTITGKHRLHTSMIPNTFGANE